MEKKKKQNWKGKEKQDFPPGSVLGELCDLGHGGAVAICLLMNSLYKIPEIDVPVNHKERKHTTISVLSSLIIQRYTQEERQNDYLG